MRGTNGHAVGERWKAQIKAFSNKSDFHFFLPLRFQRRDSKPSRNEDIGQPKASVLLE